MSDDMITMAPGYCQCGCGQRAPLAPQTMRSRGWVAGQPLRFVHGHNARRPRAKSMTHSAGYMLVYAPSHLRADPAGYVLEHIVVAELVLGKPLRAPHEVHHVNEGKRDNRPENLVICEDRAYHKLLHRRTEAYRACGYANWRKCTYCQQWDAVERLALHRSGKHAWHPRCDREYQRDKRRRRLSRR
jgi:hypothetical protein